MSPWSAPLPAAEPAGPYLRRCIAGALQHHLRDRVRLVRISRRKNEKGTCLLGHISLDARADGEPCLLVTLPARGLDQLPAAKASAMRLTVLEGLSVRAAAERMEISAELSSEVPGPQGADVSITPEFST